MSKSEGNVIDPLEMMDKYGTDALRFTLTALAVPGMDISLSEERMAGYQAFANKIWNASRFVLMNITDKDVDIKEDSLSLADRWIRSRIDTVTEELNSALDQFKFHEAADTIYHFIWHEFCDWYIELNKSDIKRGSLSSKAVLLEALDKILRLLNPFMPFITEEIGQHLPSAKKSLALASYPVSDKQNKDQTAEKQMKLLQDAITEVRTIRAENRIPPKQKIDLWIKVKEKKDEDLIKNNQDYIKTLASINNIDILKAFPSDKSFFKGISGFWELAIPLEKEIDLKQERLRLEREISKINDEKEKLEQRLQNNNFIKRAPSDVVQKTKDRLKELDMRKTKLEENLTRMRGNR
jgi:valyl-tRNA synthetase